MGTPKHGSRRGVSLLTAGLLAAVAGCSGMGDHPDFLGTNCVGQDCGGGRFRSPHTTTGGGSPTAAVDGGTTGGGAATGGGTTTGGTTPSNCSVQFGVILCLSIPECPGVTVDSTQFPSCGFQANASSFSVVCICNGSQLCPVGAVATCSALPNLLEQRSITDVCNQALTSGACRDLTTTTGGASGTVSTCDRNCAATCNNAPVCLRACGC